MVHDFVPGYRTLQDFVEAHPGEFLPESAIWRISTQLLASTRAIHSAGLACRGINVSRVLIGGRFRVRVSSVGLVHLLEPQTHVSLEEKQREDMLDLGRLVLVLCTMNMNALANMQQSVELIQSTYSPDMLNFALYAFKQTHKQERLNLYDMIGISSQGLLAEVDTLYAHSDALEENLSRCFQADRLFRLMTKLSIICERPAQPGKPQADSWSETEDRYIVKLFRDYVFHQFTADNKPWVDFGHVIDCLNNLDVGSPQQILLSSRDGKSMLVVTYQDVKVCFERAFAELMEMSGR